MTSELLCSYFLGKLLVINCQLNTFILKSVMRNLSVFCGNPKFRGLFYFHLKPTNSEAWHKILRAVKNYFL